MKKISKALLLSFCAIMLVTVSVFGTMAYLTSSDKVINTFTVGNVAITLDEQDVDNSTPNAERDQKNSYKLIPGHTYIKDPIVHVDANSEDCYLFVRVTNSIVDIEDQAKTVASQMADKGWVAVEGTAGVYVYTLDKKNPAIVSQGNDVTVFENFTISGRVNNQILAGYKDKTIKVNAYAIQADGFDGKTASQIWTAAALED